MSQKLVTVASFLFPEEAYILKGKLESRGIHSSIEHEYSTAMQWLYLTGGVTLKVRESDEAKALEIIGQERPVTQAKRKVKWHKGRRHRA